MSFRVNEALPNNKGDGKPNSFNGQLLLVVVVMVNRMDRFGRWRWIGNLGGGESRRGRENALAEGITKDNKDRMAIVIVGLDRVERDPHMDWQRLCVTVNSNKKTP